MFAWSTTRAQKKKSKQFVSNPIKLEWPQNSTPSHIKLTRCTSEPVYLGHCLLRKRSRGWCYRPCTLQMSLGCPRAKTVGLLPFQWTCCLFKNVDIRPAPFKNHTHVRKKSAFITSFLMLANNSNKDQKKKGKNKVLNCYSSLKHQELLNQMVHQK